MTILLSTSIFAQKKEQNKSEAVNEKKIVYTTLDIKQEYEIILIIAAPVDITGTFSGDPVTKAYKKAWQDFDAEAKKLNADAVVGVRVEMENMNGNIVGRLMLYGTAVKFINDQQSSKKTDKANEDAN